MTSSAVKTTIINKLQEVLPDLFNTAGLDDFEKYMDSQPDDTEKRIIGIYIAEEGDTEDFHILTLLIQAQLYKKSDYKQEYHNIIMPAIRENITASLVGYIDRDSLIGDLYPVERSGTSFAFYEIQFSNPLDDCGDFEDDS